jgi:UDP-glucose 4-epimerase
MKIILIGFPGYIASSINEKLSKSHQLIVFGKSAPQTPPLSYRSNFKEKTLFSEVLRSFQPDWVIDSAGITNLYQREPLKNSQQSDITTHRNILEAISNSSPQTKYLYFSSRQEYGIPTKIPVKENEKIKPISKYGSEKALISQMIKEMSHKLSLHSTVLRLSNLYGWPKNRISSKYSSSSAVNSMIFSAYMGSDLKVYSPGEQLRDYLHIEDLSALIEKILEKDTSSFFRTFNVGSGKGISIANMASIIAARFKKKTLLCEWPPHVKEVETGSYVSDISLVKKQFDWKPTIPFNLGIDLIYNSHLHEQK